MSAIDEVVGVDYEEDDDGELKPIEVGDEFRNLDALISEWLPVNLRQGRNVQVNRHDSKYYCSICASVPGRKWKGIEFFCQAHEILRRLQIQYYSNMTAS